MVEQMMKSSGRRRIDISTPFVGAMLPEGHRLHVVLEGSEPRAGVPGRAWDNVQRLPRASRVVISS